jgi:hypothetical protein
MLKLFRNWNLKRPRELVIREAFPKELEEALKKWASGQGRDLEELIKVGDADLKWYICKWRHNTRWVDLVSDDPAFYEPLHLIVHDSQGWTMYDLPPTQKK